MLKNGVGGLIIALGVEVLGVDSVLGLYIARFKSQSGGISGGRGGIESSDKEGDRDGVLEAFLRIIRFSLLLPNHQDSDAPRGRYTLFR